MRVIYVEAFWWPWLSGSRYLLVWCYSIVIKPLPMAVALINVQAINFDHSKKMLRMFALAH